MACGKSNYEHIHWTQKISNHIGEGLENVKLAHADQQNKETAMVTWVLLTSSEIETSAATAANCPQRHGECEPFTVLSAEARKWYHDIDVEGGQCEANHDQCYACR